MTTNFPDLVDSALRSRADVTITIPLPTAEAIDQILRSTVAAWAREFPGLKALLDDGSLPGVAIALAASGIDARQARKFVLDVLSSDLSLASAPERLMAAHLLDAARARRSAR